MSTVFADQDAIKELRQELIHFAARVHDVLPNIDAAIRRAQDELHQRERKARWQVETLTNELYHCHAAAAQGFWVNCSHLAVALNEAEQRLARIYSQQRQLAIAADHYRGAASRFASVLENDLSAAASYLDRRVTTLEWYLLTQLSSTALAVGTTGVAGLIGGVIGAMRIVAGRANALKGRTAEEVASTVLSRRFGLEEIPFTQPHHGFDRVFRSPGLPLIVVESKFSSDGALHLGQTAGGEQGSPEWVAATAQRMATPASAQWSPANQRIGELVQQLGSDNVPVLAVVTDATRRKVAVYERTNDDWILIDGEIDLRDDDLRDGEADSPNISAPSQPEPGPPTPAEHREGAIGGAERRG